MLRATLTFLGLAFLIYSIMSYRYSLYPNSANIGAWVTGDWVCAEHCLGKAHSTVTPATGSVISISMQEREIYNLRSSVDLASGPSVDKIVTIRDNTFETRTLVWRVVSPGTLFVYDIAFKHVPGIACENDEFRIYKRA